MQFQFIFKIYEDLIMSYVSNVVTNKRLIQVSLLVLGLVVATAAFSNGLSGGISTATNTANQIRTGLMTIAGVVAGIYLLYKALQSWQGRCDWGEFGMSVLYVALAGAAVTLANWAWKLLA